jgi:two-component system sensor histidine kinase/response regulator
MEKGADDYLVKPFTREELIAAIGAQWERKKRIGKTISRKVGELGTNITKALPHEFNTVLGQIAEFSKLVKKDIIDTNGSQVGTSENIVLTPQKKDDIIDSCNNILTLTDRLLNITQNYLIYARLEVYTNNPQKLEQLRESITDEPAAHLVDIATNIAGKHERMNDLEINGSISDIFIRMSSESFNKVISEVIDNAFKFSGSGNKVFLELQLLENKFSISVQDNGRGINSEQIETLGALNQFERKLFEQQGVGLGLIISKRLTEIHGGSFKISSKVGEGTRVKITLPCYSAV